MKQIFAILLLSAVFMIFNIGLMHFFSSTSKPSEEDNILEVYTPKDIIFYNLETGKIFSETGEIDTLINKRSDAIEFIAIITAKHSD